MARILKFVHAETADVARFDREFLEEFPEEELLAPDYLPATEDRHIGPYAEDVQRELGDEVAPGGRQIDMISMSGAQTAAIKGLAERLDEQDATIEALTTRLVDITRGGKFGLRGHV